MYCIISFFASVPTSYCRAYSMAADVIFGSLSVVVLLLLPTLLIPPVLLLCSCCAVIKKVAFVKIGIDYLFFPKYFIYNNVVIYEQNTSSINLLKVKNLLKLAFGTRSFSYMYSESAVATAAVIIILLLAFAFRTGATDYLSSLL